MKKVIILIGISLFFLISKTFACFSIIVGKNASKTGKVIVAHNEDDSPMKNLNIFYAGNIDKPTEITLYSNEKIFLKPPIYKILWFNLEGFLFSDSYINENGVVVFSDACNSIFKSEKAKEKGITYYLRRLIALKAKNAREGVKIAAKYIDKFGYSSSGRTYIIADENEGWMLAVAAGKYWVAARVPDDAVATIPNFYTIREVNISDTSNYYISDAVLQYVKSKKLIKNGSFDFATIFADKNSLNHPGNIYRQWGAFYLLSDLKLKPNDRFPFCFKPEQKVSIEDLKKVLRYHYEDTKYDLSENYKISPNKTKIRTICTEATVYSLIVEPNKNNTLIWFSPISPDLSPYIPIFWGIDKIDAAFYSKHFDDETKTIKFQFDSTNTKKSYNIFNEFNKFRNLANDNYFKVYKDITKFIENNEKENMLLIKNVNTPYLKRQLFEANIFEYFSFITNLMNSNMIKNGRSK